MIPYERLRANPALAPYSDIELQWLSQIGEPRAYPVGVTMLQQGSEGDGCLLVLSGRADVKKTAHGRIRFLGSLKEGDLVGQIALIDKAPRSASVVASTPVEAIEIARATFERFVDAATPFALRFQERIAVSAVRQLRGATERLSALIEQRASEHAYLHVQASMDDWSMDEAPPASIELAGKR